MAKELSDEDKALFRDHMRQVKPLSKQTKRIQETQAPKPIKHRDKNHKEPPITTHNLSDFIDESVLSNTVLSYADPSIPSKRFKALRNGQIPWEARLDLHGLKAEAAREALSRFIQTQAEKNSRCLLIIHGKGGHEGAPPVIKNLVNRWLPQMNEVLAFHSAQAKDGGHGAVYVLLKKRKGSAFYP